MSGEQIVWADPPAAMKRGRPSARYEAMRANPGKWLLYGTYPTPATANTTAYRLRRAGFETAPRGVELYARQPEVTS